MKVLLKPLGPVPAIIEKRAIDKIAGILQFQRRMGAKAWYNWPDVVPLLDLWCNDGNGNSYYWSGTACGASGDRDQREEGPWAG